MENAVKLIQHWLSDPIVIKFITAIIGIFFINLVVHFFSKSLSRFIPDADIRYRLRKAIAFTSYLASALFLTIVFNDRLGQLTVVFGVVGAGVAFALQEVIASFAGWIAISLGQFYKPGDRVQLGGIMGDVIDISILRTTVMEIGAWVKADQYSGRIVRIANSFVFKEPVFNYSADFAFVWDEITVPVKYGSDHRLARQILLQIADEVVGEYVPKAEAEWKHLVRKYLIEDARIEPIVTLVTNDNWMEFTLRYVVDYKARRVAKDRLFTRILDEFIATDGRVAFASTTVQLVETPVFDVRVFKEKNDGKKSAADNGD